MATVGRTIADRLQQIVEVVVFRQRAFKGQQPSAPAPDGRLQRSNRYHVILTAVRGRVRSGLLAKDILLQHDPVELNVRVLSLKLLGKALHDDHVAIVHGRNRQGRLRLYRRRGTAQARYAKPEDSTAKAP